MPTITILTAVLDGKHEHLSEAYESLASQVMPAGWHWQWVVQEDGSTGRPAKELPHDPRISLGQGRRSRAATARTLALGRAQGVLVRALDADDILPPNALADAITCLTARPDIAWCVGPAVDLMPSGDLVPGPRDPDSGELPAGALAAGEAVDQLPVVGTTMCTYTTLVRALGGWPAVPASEDVALMLAVEAVSRGWMLAQSVLTYRRWHGSTTLSVEHIEDPDHPSGREVMLQRATALRELGWQWEPTPLHRAELLSG